MQQYGQIQGIRRIDLLRICVFRLECLKIVEHR